MRQYDADMHKYFDSCTSSQIDESIRSSLALFQERRSAIPKKFVATLIHGDLIDEHIFTGRTSKDPLGIIDFSDAVIDDPARDFSGLYCYGKKFVRAVFKLYGGRKDDGLLERASAYRVDVAIKMLALALKGKASMTLPETKRFLSERLAE